MEGMLLKTALGGHLDTLGKDSKWLVIETFLKS
jgi:hypothetical protein